MEFEWDSRKATSNLHKHGVDFADAATVLYDELAVTIPDENPARSALSLWESMLSVGFL